MDKYGIPTKKYQIWQPDSNWYFEEFDSLEQVQGRILGGHMGQFFVTKMVTIDLVEKEDA